MLETHNQIHGTDRMLVYDNKNYGREFGSYAVENLSSLVYIIGS